MNEWDPPRARPRQSLSTVSRTVAWLRVTLWWVPGAFALFSAVGISKLIEKGYLSSALQTGLWWLSNCIFVIAVGCYDSLLAKQAKIKTDEIIYRVGLFFVLQIFIIPMVGLALIFILYVSGTLNGL